jgi:hypothetical protein
MLVALHLIESEYWVWWIIQVPGTVARDATLCPLARIESAVCDLYIDSVVMNRPAFAERFI